MTYFKVKRAWIWRVQVEWVVKYQFTQGAQVVRKL